MVSLPQSQSASVLLIQRSGRSECMGHPELIAGPANIHPFNAFLFVNSNLVLNFSLRFYCYFYYISMFSSLCHRSSADSDGKYKRVLH